MIAYLLTLTIGTLWSITSWRKLTSGDERFPVLFAGGMIFGFAGAHIGYLLCEVPVLEGRPLLSLLGGKTILGGLLGGYYGVEAAKRATGYQAPTGDLFASFVPLSCALGRIGCLFADCCTGIPIELPWTGARVVWPAAEVELVFNLVMVALFTVLRRCGRFKTQHFHLYLISYGTFRFIHEFLRERRMLVWYLSGYHLLAVLVMIFGVERYIRRASGQYKHR